MCCPPQLIRLLSSEYYLLKPNWMLRKSPISQQDAQREINQYPLKNEFCYDYRARPHLISSLSD